jgi:hypothetical protein
VKLFASTIGTGIVGIDVHLTGQVREVDGSISRLEVKLPSGCEHMGIQTDTVWADVRDLGADNAGSLSQAELRAEIERVKEQLRIDMTRGPLGEYWP